MPRPKGSRNKPKEVQITTTVEEFDAQISTVTAEIEALTSQLKAKKAELKALTKNRDAAVAAEAEKKAAEDKAKLLDAIAASGKSVDEILELLK